MFSPCSLIVLFASVVQAWTVGQVVNTTSGPFRGHLAPGSNGVSEYLGIPFGQSTDGNRRFAPPVRATFTSTVRDAVGNVSCPANPFFAPGGILQLPFASQVTFGKIGVRLYDTLTNAISPPQGEDCLLLNIWTKPQTGETGKAVLLWIYGGAFAYGAIGTPEYSGRYLADMNDVVVVAINYRSNILGFPGAPNTRQNLQFLDQRMGIEWVRDNIAAFGGDPKRISVFGVSSGGGSLDYYAQAWTKDPIVNALIPMSGSVYGLSPNAQGSKESAWFSAAQKAGCPQSAGNDAVLACMRSKSYQQIMAAIAGDPGYGSVVSTLTYGPIVDNVVVFSDWAIRSKTGNVIKVPRLTGTVDNEVDVIIPVGTALNGFVPPQPVVDATSLQVFQCACSNTAGDLAANGIKTYRYRYYAIFDNTAIGLGNTTTRAYHASDVSLVFGTSGDGGIPNTPAENAIRSQMMDIYTTFAKDPTNGLANKFKWPAYTPINGPVMRLGYQNTTSLTTVGSLTYDVPCAGLTILSIPNLLAQLLGPK